MTSTRRRESSPVRGARSPGAGVLSCLRHLNCNGLDCRAAKAGCLHGHRNERCLILIVSGNQKPTTDVAGFFVIKIFYANALSRANLISTMIEKRTWINFLKCVNALSRANLISTALYATNLIQRAKNVSMP